MRILVSGAGFSVTWGHPVTKHIPDTLRELVKKMPPQMRQGASREEMEKAFGSMEEWLPAEAPEDIKEKVRGWAKEVREHGLTDADVPPGPLENVVRFLDQYARSARSASWDYEDLLTFFKGAIDEKTRDDVAAELGIEAEAFYYPDPEWYFETLLYGLGAALNWTGPAARAHVDGGVRVPSRYREFENTYGPIDGVITLNYDMVPEYALSHGRSIDYGLSKARLVRQFIEHDQEGVTGQYIHRMTAKAYSRPKNGFPVFKLHGSLNMAYCPKCGHVLVIPHGNFDEAKPLVEHAWLGTLGYHCAMHCGTPNLRSPPSSEEKLRPLMVPPLADKRGLPELDLLEDVKRAAIELVGRADEVLVVGTKVRPSDGALHEVLQAGAGKKFTFLGTDAEAKRRLDALIAATSEKGWDRL